MSKHQTWESLEAHSRVRSKKEDRCEWQKRQEIDSSGSPIHAFLRGPCKKFDCRRKTDEKRVKLWENSGGEGWLQEVSSTSLVSKPTEVFLVQITRTQTGFAEKDQEVS